MAKDYEKLTLFDYIQNGVVTDELTRDLDMKVLRLDVLKVVLRR